jgi:SNF2 family DNA or RNA helicase
MLLTPQKMINLCDNLMTNFKVYIPKIMCNGPQMISSKFKSDIFSIKNKYRILYNNLNRIPNVQKYFSLFKIISCPDKKLVEYDSGKLIKLAALLKKLKSNKSKVLIFTQMTRMLDILEIFLNLHGYSYVRLDGSTKVEVRQQVVDRFNTDQKIFCFISSTRSGGIGINLTGADSIVFYDTDWNPAMDKQAQDRCHRIGQTRTVHIYRLITMSTIEENIFKKSIQKRELNFVIMEDGKFDMENFNKINFKSLVHEEHLIKDNNNQNDKSDKDTADEKIKKLLEFENLKFDNEEDQKNLEQLLIRIEDQEDVQALKNVSKEMLGEYEKENEEQQFFNTEEVNK